MSYIVSYVYILRTAVHLIDDKKSSDFIHIVIKHIQKFMCSDCKQCKNVEGIKVKYT